MFTQYSCSPVFSCSFVQLCAVVFPFPVPLFQPGFMAWFGGESEIRRGVMRCCSCCYPIDDKLGLDVNGPAWIEGCIDTCISLRVWMLAHASAHARTSTYVSFVFLPLCLCLSLALPLSLSLSLSLSLWVSVLPPYLHSPMFGDSAVSDLFDF